MTIDDVLGRIAGRADCLAQSVYVQNAVACPPAVCGDGMQSSPRGVRRRQRLRRRRLPQPIASRPSATSSPPPTISSRSAIFENHGCTDHDLPRQRQVGRARSARRRRRTRTWSTSMRRASPGAKRVSPGRQGREPAVDQPGRRARCPISTPRRCAPCRSALPPISTDELEALRLVDRNRRRGARREPPRRRQPARRLRPRAATGEDRAARAAAAPGTGVQLHMPAYTLKAAERDRGVLLQLLRHQRPDAGRVPHRRRPALPLQERRHPPGSAQPSSDRRRLPRHANRRTIPSWGVYKCRGGEHDGAVCDPLDLTFCGSGGCATDPDPTAIACIGFGPTTGSARSPAAASRSRRRPPRISASRTRSTTSCRCAASCCGTRTPSTSPRRDGTLEAWVNITFPEPERADLQGRADLQRQQDLLDRQLPADPRAGAGGLRRHGGLPDPRVRAGGRLRQLARSRATRPRTSSSSAATCTSTASASRSSAAASPATAARTTARRARRCKPRCAPARHVRRRRRPRSAAGAAVHQLRLQRSGHPALRPADPDLRLRRRWPTARSPTAATTTTARRRTSRR